MLDARTHPKHSLFHVNLGDAQGPSLLAYNDALFSQEDWEALQSIHRSSKKTDTSKIGKYGIGFRSCYHVCAPRVAGPSTHDGGTGHRYSADTFGVVTSHLGPPAHLLGIWGRQV